MLRNLEHTIINSTDEYRGASRLFERTLRAYDFDAGALYVVTSSNSDRFELVSAIGFSQEYRDRIRTVSYGQGFSGSAIALKTVRASGNITSDTRFSRKALQKEGFQSIVSVPLMSRTKIWGVANFASKKTDRIDHQKRVQLALLGEAIGSYLGRRIEVDESQKNEHLIRQLYLLGTEIFRNNDLDKICNMALEETRTLLNHSCGLIAILQPKKIVFTDGVVDDDEKITSVLIGEMFDCLNNARPVITREELAPSALLDFVTENNINHLCMVNLGTDSNPLGILALGINGNSFNSFSYMACKQLGESLALTVHKYFTTIEKRDHAILQEYNRISWELHDSLAQQLSAIANQVEYIKRKMKSMHLENTLYDDLTILHKLVDLTNFEIRNVILDLRALKDQETIPFREAIERYFQVFQIGSPDMELDINIGVFEDTLPVHTQTQLLRIIQESCTNIRKHSHATKLNFSLESDDTTITILIKDNGVGFDTRVTNPKAHGLLVMRERAEEIGAQFGVTSKLGKGTTVTVSIAKRNFAS